MIALFLCVIARDLVLFLGLAPHWVLLLRVQAFAGLGQFLLFTIMLFLLYLDQRRAVLLVVALFLLAACAAPQVVPPEKPTEAPTPAQELQPKKRRWFGRKSSE